MRYGLVIIVAAFLVACSNDAENGHVWKDQTDMIDKAKGVEDTLNKSNQQQRQQIDEVAQ